ncbi:SDR family oxidoreductase [Arundinibacter roseus]|uniref:SDR family oxidoreductase n=1 Tax=Arundinibacter roseus TaxID=2070510 RepID=A0A4V2X8U4_9BACT|nr:SDR family oxidoreductase [Arundinibacter roseus]TDB61165.1 SDR family oxidoreductase [Arundinibacter roseus]
MMSNKVLITGATGTIGKELIRQLQANDTTFVAGSREFSKAAQTLGIGQEQWVNLDFDQPETFETPTSEVDAVFVLGPPLRFHMEETMIPFLDFLWEKGIKRVVYLSALGNESLGGGLAFHGIVEEYIQRKGFDFTILQPSFFAQNFKNFEYENVTQRGIIYVVAGDGKVGFVDVRDIAKVAAQVLNEDGHSGKIYRLTGSDLLDYQEAAQILTEVLGKQITYLNPSEEEFRATLSAAGAPPFIADYMLPVYGMIKTGTVSFLTNDIEQVTGEKPTSLREVLIRDFSV